jgi:hypothetical protein
MIGQQQLCRCKKMKVWVVEGQWTTACPICGRKYFGVYSVKKCQIVGKRYPTRIQLAKAECRAHEAPGDKA